MSALCTMSPIVKSRTTPTAADIRQQRNALLAAAVALVLAFDNPIDPECDDDGITSLAKQITLMKSVIRDCQQNRC